MSALVDVVVGKSEPKQGAIADARIEWLCAVVQGVEYMLRDAAEPATPNDAYSADALAALRNMQTLGEDLLAAFVRAGQLSQKEANHILREARMGA